MNKRAVLVTTAHRGVFFGYTEAEGTPESIQLTGARCAILWGTTGGFLELAETGPTNKSKIGSRADIGLRDVTSVAEVTETAVEAWENA